MWLSLKVKFNLNLACPEKGGIRNSRTNNYLHISIHQVEDENATAAY
jgi:hypothetical protein